MNLHKWFREHSLKLLAIRDTPGAVARGVGIGVFLGFMPVPGLKTLSAIFLAWVTGSNVLAAVITGALHDVLFPIMPAIYYWEYEVGFWLMNSPHHWPAPIHSLHLEGPLWHFWDMFVAMGKPLLVGGFVCSLPTGLISFILAHRIVARHQHKRMIRELVQGTGS